MNAFYGIWTVIGLLILSPIIIGLGIIAIGLIVVIVDAIWKPTLIIGAVVGFIWMIVHLAKKNDD